MKNVISTSNAPAAIGPYSQAIKTDNFLFASGQVAINPATGNIEAETVSDQAEQCMKNVGAILEEAGFTYADVIKTTCFLADMSYFNDFNEVYGKYFPAESAPARSCVAVKGIPKGALCEVEVIVCK